MLTLIFYVFQGVGSAAIQQQAQQVQGVGSGDAASHLQQLTQPNSNMTDRSVDSGVGSDVALMDFMDDDANHQGAAPPINAKSPDKALKVKHQGHETTTPTKDKKDAKGDSKKSKEKSPKDKSKKNKKSKNKAALKQGMDSLALKQQGVGDPTALAAEINASITALKSPSDVPDDLSMPFTLPGFEAFNDEEPTPVATNSAKTDKHSSSKPSRKRKKDRDVSEDSVPAGQKDVSKNNDASETPSVNNGVKQMDMLPDTITFTENELSDVLDQVESLGQSLSDSTTTTTTPKSPGAAAAVVIESVLDTPKLPPPTPPNSERKSKNRNRKKKGSLELPPEAPPSKRKKVSDAGGDQGTSADILKCAMDEGIGRLDLDPTDPTDGADKMTIDLSAAPSDTSDAGLESPPFTPSKPPALPSSGEKRKGGGRGGSVEREAKTLDIPTFGYSPIKPTSDNTSKTDVEHETTSSKDKEKDAGTLQLGVSSANTNTNAFYTDMDDAELTISTDMDPPSGRGEKQQQQGSPSPVSMVKGASLLDIIPPMTPRTVDHLAKTLGCDPVTPFDGDSLANMDGDDYPWLNTPSLPAPPTPATAQARHVTIASLARIDARPAATPKHPSSKPDSKSYQSNKPPAASEPKISPNPPTNPPPPSSSSSKPDSSSPNKTDKNEPKPQEKPLNLPQFNEKPQLTIPPFNNLEKPSSNLNIPPFSDKPSGNLNLPQFNDKPASSLNSPQYNEKPSSCLNTNNQFQANSQSLNQSGSSTNINSQSAVLDKAGQSASSRKTQPDESRGTSARAHGATSPAVNMASLKPPGSNSSTSSTTSPIKHNNNSNNTSNSGNNTKLSPPAGSGYSSNNRLSPAGPGDNKSSHSYSSGTCFGVMIFVFSGI